MTVSDIKCTLCNQGLDLQLITSNYCKKGGSPKYFLMKEEACRLVLAIRLHNSNNDSWVTLWYGMETSFMTTRTAARWNLSRTVPRREARLHSASCFPRRISHTQMWVLCEILCTTVEDGLNKKRCRVGCLQSWLSLREWIAVVY